MKTLTEKRVSQVPEFYRAPWLDFGDDGNHFIGFEYKGLPLTQCRNSYGTFLSFRVDYLSENKKLKFCGTYHDYSKQPWYPLCDKYNGVPELPEMEELVKDLETVVAGVKALNAKLESETIDTEPILKRLEIEYKLAQDAYDNFKSTIDLFDPRYTEYDVSNIRSYMRSLKQAAFNAETTSKRIKNNEYSIQELRHLYEQATHSYIYTEDENVWAKWIQKIVDKVN